VGGVYQEPENLGATVNSEAAELTPFITPDQHLLLFSAIGRPDMKPGRRESLRPQRPLRLRMAGRGVDDSAKTPGARE